MNHENQLQAYLTLDPARNRIRIHRQTIRLLKNPAYVQFLVNPEELYIAVLGSDKPISGGTANKVRMSNTSQQSIEFYSTILIKNFSELLGGFDLRFNYQLFDGFEGKICDPVDLIDLTGQLVIKSQVKATQQFGKVFDKDRTIEFYRLLGCV